MKKVSILVVLLFAAVVALADGGPMPNCQPCPDGHGGRTWCCAR